MSVVIFHLYFRDIIRQTNYKNIARSVYTHLCNDIITEEEENLSIF